MSATRAHAHTGWRYETPGVLDEDSNGRGRAKAGVAVSANRNVSIVLSDLQVAQVARQLAGRASFAGLLPEASDLDGLRRAVLPLLDNDEYSRATYRALLVLAAFPADGSEVALTAIARELGLSPSTAHRYIATWMAIGLLVQEPGSRRYRRTAYGAAQIAHESSTTEGIDAS
ncbi:MAG: helix-turn-helix domain-containing protein [Solirubrobacteraceae bacterium]